MGERLYVYDAKVSIRSKLEILQTIRAKLSWKQARLDIFARTVFGPWLDIKSTQHDNHFINFLLQHHRFIDKPSPNQPFIFDIDGHTLEYGRDEFCLITGFRFGKVTLDPDEEDNSEFSKRVFPKNVNIKGENLLELLNKDAKFAKLDDQDAVRVCLLLAYENVFMGNEARHVVPKPILNLVDDLYKWDAFPWGEYFWSFFHKRDYNVAVKRREFHLEKCASNSKYEANYVLYGFVYPLKIWGLEIFSKSIHWWRRDQNVIPRGVAWSNGLKFEKEHYEKLFYSENSILKKMIPSDSEKKERWWISSLDFFKKNSYSPPVLRSATQGSIKPKSVRTRVRTEFRHEVHVRTQVCSVQSTEVFNDPNSKNKANQEKEQLLETVKEQQQMILDLQNRLHSVEEKLKPAPPDISHGDETCKTFNNITESGLDENYTGGVSDKNGNMSKNGHVRGFDEMSTECMNVDEPDKIRKDVSLNFDDVNLDHKPVDGASQCTGLDEHYTDELSTLNAIQIKSLDQHDKNRNDVIDSFDAVDLEHKSVDGASQCTGVNDECECVAANCLISLWSQRTDDPYVDGTSQSLGSDDLSTQQVTELIDGLINTPPSQEKDDEPFEHVTKDGIENISGSQEHKKDDVFVDIGVDAEQVATKDLPRLKFPGKVLLSPYMKPPSTEVKCRKRRRECIEHNAQIKLCKSVVAWNGDEVEIFTWKEDVTRAPNAPKRTISVPAEVNALFRDKNRSEMKWTFPWCRDGWVVRLEFWEKLVGRSHTKRGWLATDHLDVWINYLWQFREPDADWVMASPFLSEKLSRCENPLYYADGITYGVPWFSSNVQKVYFPINEKDKHWVLGEFHICSGLITIYDTLGPPKAGTETSLFWLDMSDVLSYHIPLFLENAKVLEKRNIDKSQYKISFEYVDGVPLQGGLYGDCGLWVMIFLYRLSHNIPLDVDDANTFALAYRERFIEFFWKYKIAA